MLKCFNMFFCCFIFNSFIPTFTEGRKSLQTLFLVLITIHRQNVFCQVQNKKLLIFGLFEIWQKLAPSSVICDNFRTIFFSSLLMMKRTEKNSHWLKGFDDVGREGLEQKKNFNCESHFLSPLSHSLSSICLTTNFVSWEIISTAKQKKSANVFF